MDRALEKALAEILTRVRAMEQRLNDIDTGLDYLMGVNDVAKVFGTTQATIRAWVADGRLRAVYLPRQTVGKYRRSDVVKLLESL